MPKYIVLYWDDNVHDWIVYWYGTNIREARRLKKKALEEESEFVVIYERKE